MAKKPDDWFVSSDAIGVRSCRRLLQVCSRGKSQWCVEIASTDYTGNFTKKQQRVAQQVANALNAADTMWDADPYQDWLKTHK